MGLARSRSSVGELLGDHLDARSTPWRLHVFTDIREAPRCDGPATVAVLQVSHATADGVGASGIARRLFGTEQAGAVPPRVHSIPDALLALRGILGMPWGIARTVRNGIDVFRFERAPEQPARPPDGFELTALNVPPARSVGRRFGGGGVRFTAGVPGAF
ncbi:MAG: hypothetical protein ICV72_02570, partial [Aldersonia sp.]|nr:hypothetical protein [Aldersonia sp.]